MSRTLWLTVALTLVTMLNPPVASASVEPGTDSFVHVVGLDRSDPARPHTWTDDSARLEMSAGPDELVVEAQSDTAGSPELSIEFRTAYGEQLGPGAYENAADYHDALPLTDRPTISLGWGCLMQRGRFEIFELDRENSRLSMIFEVECSNRRHIFGEIKINQPTPASGLSSVPSRIDWPSQYPGAAERDVVVEVTNKALEPMTVDEVVVSEGTEVFSVVEHDCDVLAPAGSCAVRVGFTPLRAGPVTGLLTVRDSTTGRSGEVPLTGAGIPGVTGLQLRREPDEQAAWRGDPAGAEDHWVAPEHITLGEGHDTRVTLWSSEWYVDFRAPQGHVLAPGQTFDTAEGALVWVSQVGHPSCERGGYGRVRVLDAAYDPAGELKRFNAAFVFGCAGGSGSRVHGSVAYRSVLPMTPPPPRLDIDVERRSHTFGDPLPISVTLDDSVKQRRVAVVTSGKGTAVVLGEFVVPGGSTVTATVPVPRRSGFITVRGTKPDRDVASDLAIVSVNRNVTIRLPDPPRTVGRYAVHPAGASAPVRVDVAPGARSGHVRVAVQRKSSTGQWRWVSDRFEVEVRRGVAEFSLQSRPALRHRPLRIRATYPAAGQLGLGRSGWAHLMFGHRHG